MLMFCYKCYASYWVVVLGFPPTWSIQILNTYIWSAGLLERMLMFSSGVGIGILSSSLSSKKDLDSLNGTLKWMENLVQDLQDELEMKEGLTVKELPNETSGELDGKSTTVEQNHLYILVLKSLWSFLFSTPDNRWQYQSSHPWFNINEQNWSRTWSRACEAGVKYHFKPLGRRTVWLDWGNNLISKCYAWHLN